MNYIQYMKPGNRFWTLPNGLEDVSWSEFWNNWKQAIEKAKDQIIDNWENLKQDYKDAADPIAASERKQAESIEATRAKQASMKFVSDNRTDYEKKRDVKNLELKEFEQKEQLNKDATDAVMWTLTGIPYAIQHLASPNGVVKTYGNTKASVQSGGGPYLEKAVASAAGDVLDATILAAPLFTPEARLARAMNKNIRNTTLQPTVADKAVLRGQLGWAPKQTIPYRHGSLDPNLKTFVPKHDRWDVVTHGADPYMYFVTDLSTPVSAANMMDLRPYQYTGSIVAEKPMVQVGDFNVAGKNATRNQLIARARQQGADTYLLQDIVDNKVPYLNIVARFIGPEGEAVQGGTLLQTKTTPTKTSLAFFESKPAKISEAARLGISKLLRHSIYKPSMAKYEAKLIGDKEIGVFDQNGNKIGYIQLRSKGNDLEVAYIERNKEYVLPEGEKFQEIGFEAARQYAAKLGKKLSTSDSFEHPLYLIPVIVEGFLTRPLKSKNRIHWNADPADVNMDMAARIQVVKNRLQLHDPFLTFGDMELAFELSNLGQSIPIDSRGNSVSIYSLPELYDYKGRFIKPKWWQYIEEDSQVSNVYDELLHGYDVPGFYESWIGKPKRNFGVKFHFKSGGSIYIKKKNRGSFTRYCNGKVTEECIRKGKNSSNPTTRKRANFAWVARHKFKHEEGGKINYLNIF